MTDGGGEKAVEGCGDEMVLECPCPGGGLPYP